MYNKFSPWGFADIGNVRFSIYIISHRRLLRVIAAQGDITNGRREGFTTNTTVGSRRDGLRKRSGTRKAYITRADRKS